MLTATTRIPFTVTYIHGGIPAAVPVGTQVRVVRWDGEMYFIQLADGTRTWVGKSKLIIPEAE